MARPKTRAGRFVYYKKRFTRRVRRQTWSKPYKSGYYKVGQTGYNHPNGPWKFKNDGVPQVSLHVLLKNPKNGLLRPPYIIDPVISAGRGFKNPPHIRMQFHVEPDGYHYRYLLYDFFNRPVYRLGHKIGRNNGFKRQCWWALSWYLASKRYVGEPGYWPSWDPLHRTPVDDTPPWEV